SVCPRERRGRARQRQDHRRAAGGGAPPLRHARRSTTRSGAASPAYGDRAERERRVGRPLARQRDGAMDGRWRLQLLGQLRAIRGVQTVGPFQTQKTGALLAYLAYPLSRPHPRELLIELLWPELESSSGRHSLSMALSSLRRQLEPPGTPAGAVIVAN